MNLSQKIPIRTERLILRLFQESDLEALYAYHSNPEVARYVYWEAKTRAETRQDLEKKLTRTSLVEDGDALTLGAVLVENNVLIGEVVLVLYSKEHKQAEFGFAFNPQYHGRGYATEAAGAILDLGFNEIDFHRISGSCDARNSGSYRLMERLGMRREAHLIENEIFKGDWGSEFVYAILKREWAAR